MQECSVGSAECDAMWFPGAAAAADEKAEQGALLFAEVMRECRENPPGARLSAKLRAALERLSPEERRAVVSRTAEGAFPLLVAARRGNTELVEYLVHVCAAPLEQRGPFPLDDGRAPHVVTPLWAAAVAGRLGALRALADAGADLNAASDSGSTPARSACFMTHLEVVRFLAERGADLQRPNHNGGTCLINAVQSPRLCRFLLERGARVDAADTQGKTALHYAVQEQRADSARLLLAAGADPLRRTRAGDDALRIACVRGAAGLAALLAARTRYPVARLADAHELLGATQLDELNDAAAALSSWRRATVLRHAGPAYVAKRPVRAPVAALGYAREWRSMEELEALAPDPDALRTQALLVAVRVLGPDHKDTLFRLMYRGAAYADSLRYARCVELWRWALELRVARDTLLAHDTAQTAAALTRLVVEAAAGGQPAGRWAVAALAPLAAGMEEAARLVRLRPACRRQRAAHDLALRCAVHLVGVAAEGGEAEAARPLVALLVRSGARTAEGDTPLHVAAAPQPAPRSTYFARAGGGAAGAARAGAVAALLAAGAAPDARNAARQTPLHAAARAPAAGVAEALVAAGAHLDRPDPRGGCPAARLAAWGGAALRPLEHVSLACLAARALLAGPAPPPDALPRTLHAFLDLHRP